MEEGDTDWERAHLIGWEWCGGVRHRLTKSALESGSGVGEGDTDWERAHLRVEGTAEERHRLGESALDRVGMVWRREMPTGKGRN